jgi:16S rRNA (adenine1518-N6/adenine1519-N6)-dimethyltransferase
MKRTRRHALGQHFLVNRSVLDKIVRAIGPEASDVIVEIGPGRALTFLSRASRAVIAVEKDAAFVPFSAKGRAERDHRRGRRPRHDFARLLEAAGGAGGRAKLVGNLPYSVSSPILFMALDAHALFAKCVFLLQKEVADRVCGRPGTKNHSPMSILLQDRFEARVEFRVSPGSFAPPPKVDSALLSLTRRAAPLFPARDGRWFRRFLAAAFAHRRKLLVRNLEMSGLPHERIGRMPDIGLARNARAEELPADVLFAIYAKMNR